MKLTDALQAYGKGLDVFRFDGHRFFRHAVQGIINDQDGIPSVFSEGHCHFEVRALGSTPKEAIECYYNHLYDDKEEKIIHLREDQEILMEEKDSFLDKLEEVYEDPDSPDIQTFLNETCLKQVESPPK